MNKPALHDVAEILQILPHRSPFLFVDRVVELRLPDAIAAERELRPDEPFFQGHFPGRPVMPGVLVAEALAQTSGLLVGFGLKEASAPGQNAGPLLFLAGVNMKFPHPAGPGDTLLLKAALTKQFGALYLFDVSAYVQATCIASGTLTLGEANPAPPGAPDPAASTAHRP